MECLAFRFRSCAGYDEAFTASVHREGSQRETFIQERELFGFFVTDCSAIEPLLRAILHNKCNAQPEAVPNSYAEGYEGINLKNTASKFNIAFKDGPLSEALRRTTTRQEYQDWKEIRNVLRNVLLHRSPNLHPKHTNRDRQ